MLKAAAYLRSSKDRSDVSLSAQLVELQTVATTRQLQIIRTYEDAVQSGSTDDRPAFRDLIADIKNPQRGWTSLLVYDTSRIARGRYIAQAFRHECRRRGVELIIARMPETDPVSAVILEAVLEAMDEVHSIMSREKGLAGMRENVRRGWRAGGRAPYGYALHHETTGAIRDGKPVMKSRLVPSDDAPTATKYMKLRAGGMPRVEAMQTCKLELAPTTLIGMEWNALVYAGHTVWNRHTSKKDRGAGKGKRRGRDDWMIQRDTHVALISEAEAESIVTQLETSSIGKAVSAGKAAGSNYLLSGLLQTPDGQLWVGAGHHYRLKPKDGRRGKRVARTELEQSIIARVRKDLGSAEFVDALVTSARQATQAKDPAAPVRQEIEKLSRRRARAVNLALGENGDVYASAVADLGRQIEALRREAEALDREATAGHTMQTITPTMIREIIMGMDNDRALLHGVLKRVVLDEQLTGRIEYGLLMASPRRLDRWAATTLAAPLRLAG